MNSYNLLVNSQYWNRKVLNAYWIVVMISLLVESVNLIFTLEQTQVFIVRFILLPTLLQVAIMVATESANFYLKRYNDYLLILTSALLVVVLVNVHSTVHVIFATFVLPTLMSIIFYNTRKVIFSSLISTVLYLAVCWLNPVIHQKSPIIVICTMIGVLGGGMITALGIVSRGKEVTQYLKRAIESEQRLMQKAEAMEKLVKTDALTGLFNVREFAETLSRSMRHAHLRGEKLSLLLVDIDFFKNVNDTYGHPAGDEVLKELGKVLVSVCRSFDIVSRNGGEEFSIILPDCPFSHAIEIGERVRSAVSRHPFFLPNRECITITVSIGVATYPETAANSEGLIQLADDGLYHAKRTGRNKVASLHMMEAGV
ncbi:MAG: GGDEF domain-containing protein [Tumebacillaceae bacterium]